VIGWRRLCLTAVPLSARPLSVVVTVYPEGEKDGVQAYVYVKQTPSAVAVAVESGDWLTADKEGLAGETVGSLRRLFVAFGSPSLLMNSCEFDVLGTELRSRRCSSGCCQSQRGLAIGKVHVEVGHRVTAPLCLLPVIHSVIIRVSVILRRAGHVSVVAGSAVVPMI
jgi:hypothetical protein